MSEDQICDLSPAPLAVNWTQTRELKILSFLGWLLYPVSSQVKSSCAKLEASSCLSQFFAIPEVNSVV
ncbi:hypothetical protein DO97_14930 [Neosynechococcus sphagnicola sy1]|uniref:Uncharacterized protein n=1 Tax=Neosynechococcus sphagnicola sy1 TaxID=1497020 RepID=A0A098TLW9_9CYAN|nr:hypothetical protein DO97_14930 [Neosynechococcus sphagnicola sy1]